MSKVMKIGGFHTVDKNILVAICEKGGSCVISELRDKIPELNDKMFMKYMDDLSDRLGYTAKNERGREQKMRFPDTPVKKLPEMTHRVVLADLVYLNIKIF